CKQRNTNYFKGFKHWALERDFMDSSFNSMFRGMYTFLNSSEKKRNLLLTTQSPINGNDFGFYRKHLSGEQNRIINKALSSKNYFLLNGPPGTGKTSIIIKELVRELHKDQSCNILLLAYTNRAVDELCETVNNAIINFEDINGNFISRERSDRNF